MDYGIIVHGGAGSFTLGSKRELELRRRVLRNSANAGFRVLARGRSCTDAVEAAISVLENSGIFNAGLGSCLTVEGEIRTDASIMNGDLSCGSIGDANITRNPISLARTVMEKSDHVLIVGSGSLSKFAGAVGYPIREIKPNALRRKQYKLYLPRLRRGVLKEWPRNSKLQSSYQTVQDFDKSDTVGAVAIDLKGKVCSGVSTGGRWLKLPGRVGDSAVVGAGLYADNASGAACATGAGEEIIRVTLCKTVCDLMRIGADAQTACDAAINMLSSARGIGTAGVIAVDKHGHFGASRNTEVLARAFRFSSMRKTHVALLPHEKDPLHASDIRSKKLRF